MSCLESDQFDSNGASTLKLGSQGAQNLIKENYLEENATYC